LILDKGFVNAAYMQNKEPQVNTAPFFILIGGNFVFFGLVLIYMVYFGMDKYLHDNPIFGGGHGEEAAEVAGESAH